jgi:hypothetical protein
METCSRVGCEQVLARGRDMPNFVALRAAR